MKNSIHYFHPVQGIATGLLGLCLMAFCLGAQATAPRITPKMFGEEKKSDIAAYQTTPFDARAEAESAMTVELVAEACKAGGEAPVVDVLPSRQLASYALFNGDVLALIGTDKDMAEMGKNKYRKVTFYLGVDGSEPVVLIFGKTRGNELYHACNEGMLAILNNGRYLGIVEKHLGQRALPAGYANRLKRHNPGWK